MWPARRMNGQAVTAYFGAIRRLPSMRMTSPLR